MTELQQQEMFIRFLEQFISDNKLQRFNEVLDLRTRFITVVLEDIQQAQNASAVIRTAECLGIQDIHVIEQDHQYTLNPDVVVGSSKWINIVKHKKNENNTRTCFERLRAKGYKIYSTTPHKDDVTPENISLDQPIALIFGNETEGLSETAMNEADGYLRIPMFGFTESYNISVSAAISLYALTLRLRASEVNWKLSDAEKNEIRIKWIRKVVKRFDLLETEFYTKHGGKK